MKLVPHEDNAAPTQPPTNQTAPPDVMDDDSEKVLAHTDSRYFDIGDELPSRMAFYPFDHLSIRPYTLSELFKLGAASKSQKVRYVVEAVAATIDKPIDNVLYCDFIYMCFWLRTMSYKKMPFTLTWLCEATSHQYSVLEEGVPKETLKNEILIARRDIRVSLLDKDKVEKSIETLFNEKVVVYPQTVATYLELDSIAQSEVDPEDAFLYPYASILSGHHHGKSVKARVAFLRSLQDNPKGIDLFEELETVSNHFKTLGVHESVQVECAHCKVKQEVTPQVNLLSFFPFGN